MANKEAGSLKLVVIAIVFARGRMVGVTDGEPSSVQPRTKVTVPPSWKSETERRQANGR